MMKSVKSYKEYKTNLGQYRKFQSIPSINKENILHKSKRSPTTIIAVPQKTENLSFCPCKKVLIVDDELLNIIGI